jgi:hypothetical protein
MQSFDKCTGGWIFRIDADEIIRTEDAIKLRQLVDNAEILFPGVKIFWFTTVNFFLDDKHYKTGVQEHVWFPDVHKRLHKNEAKFRVWTQPAHERMVAEDRYGRLDYIDNFREFPYMHVSNWFSIYHYGYLQPKKTRIKDAEKYKKMGVKLHVLDNKQVEPWVWKKPDLLLPPGWGTGICEYASGEKG